MSDDLTFGFGKDVGSYLSWGFGYEEFELARQLFISQDETPPLKESAKTCPQCKSVLLTHRGHLRCVVCGWERPPRPWKLSRNLDE